MKKIVFLFFCLIAFKVSAQTLTVTANNVGLASSPLVAGATAQKVLGFRVSVSGSASITIQSISFSNIGTQHASSANVSTFVGTTETVQLSGGTISANAISFTGSLMVFPGTPMDLFLVIVVNSSATSATTQTGPTLGTIVIDTSGGATISQPSPISSGPFSFISNNTTIAVSDTGRPGPDFINSTLYAAGTSTTGTSTVLFGITFTDVGGDSFPTIITSLQFTISNANNLTKAGLYDGTSQVGADVVVAADGTVTFTGSPLLTIPAGSGKTITLRAAFDVTVEDNDYLNVALIAGATQVGGSSTLETINSDPVSTTIRTATDVSNKINVVATKQVVATTTPVLVGSREVFDFTINATDNAGNLDEDYAGSATISKAPATGTMTMGDTGSDTDSFVNGVVSWSNVNIDALGNYTLTSTATGSLDDVQFMVNVSGVSITYTPNTSVPAFCSNGTTKNIGDIVISENSNNNFTAGTSVTLHLLLPYGFVFDNSVTSGLIKSTISDITIPLVNCYTYSRGNTVVIISFTVTGTRFPDVLTIRGLKVKYTADNPTTVITGNIIRIGGTAIIAGNTANGKAVHGTLKAADATNAIFGSNKAPVPNFVTAAGNGVSAGQTTFDENIQTVNINPTPNASATNVFYGDGITQSGSGTNRTVTFSPQAVGLGDYPITYKVKEVSTGQGCYTQTTINFTVVQIFSGLRNSYCTNTTIRDLVSLPFTKMVGSTSYTLQAIAYYEGTTTSGNIGFTGTGANRTFYFPITGNIPTGEVTWSLRALYQSAGGSFILLRDVAFHVPPVVSVSGLPASGEICNTTSSISLTGTPSGGVFSGPGITTGTTGSIFSPGTVPIANQDINQPVTLSYTYTDTNGCSNTSSSQVKVVPPPVSGFTTSADISNNIICKPLNPSGQPQPVTVTFTNTSSVPPTNRTEIRGYTWDFGESSSGGNNQSIITSPSHIYTDAGDHTVRLSVAGAGGCTAESTTTIKIGTIPDVRIITLQNAQEFCSDELAGTGKSVTLNISQGKNEYKIGPAANPWIDIGTTTTFKLKNTTATLPDFDFSSQINTPTSISYRNTETGTGCTNTIMITVSAYNAPTVDFTTNANLDNVLCRPLSNEILQSVTATFTNTTTGYDDVTTTAASTTVTAWKWNFGTSANNTSTAHSPTYAYNTSGEYQITLEATGRGGCVRTLTRSLKVGDTPNPKFISIQNNQEFCSDELMGTGKAITLTISSGVNEYKVGTDPWIPIGTSSVFHLKNSNTAAPDFNYSSYINSSTGIIYKNTDDFSGCNNSISINITAYNPPITVNFTTNANSDNALCRLLDSNEILQSVTATFTNTTKGYDNVTTTATSTTVTAWKWNFGTSATNNISTAHSPTYAYNTSGEYQITLEATGRGGCVRTLTRSLKVGDTPNPKFISIQNNEEFCSDELMGTGKAITLTISSGVNEYKVGTDPWIPIGTSSVFHLKNSNTAAPDFNYSGYINSQTNIIYKNTDDFSGCNNSITITITAYNPPTVNFTTNANSNSSLCRLLNTAEEWQPVDGVFTNATTGWDGLTTNLLWKWNFGVPSSALNESTTKDGSFSYNSSGTYTILLEARGKGGCVRTISKSIIVGDTPNPKFITRAADFCADDLTTGIALDLNLATGTNYFSVNNGAYTSIGTTNSLGLTKASSAFPNVYDYSARIGLPTLIKYKNIESLGKCENEISKTIVVYKPPTIAFREDSTLVNGQGNNVLCLPLNANGLNTSIANQFYDKSKVAANNNNGLITSWEWDFGDTGTSTLQNPTHTYTSYNENGRVTLNITGSGNCRRSLTKSLLIGRIPNPKFLFADFYKTGGASYCESDLVPGISVTLSLANGTNEYSILGSTYKSIGNNNTFILYGNTPATGIGNNYLFNLSYIDQLLSIVYKNTENVTTCSNTTTGELIVHKLPLVSFSARESSGVTDFHCLLPTGDIGTDFYLEAPSNQPGYLDGINENVNWDFGDGTGNTVSKTKSINHKYNSAGEYRVRLEIKDQFTCQNSKAVTFPVVYQPVAGCYAAKLCATEGTEFKFTTSLPAETERTKATYKFDFGDHMTIRNSLDASTWQGVVISHPYAELGKYSVKLTVSDSIISGGSTYACANSKSMTIGIVPQVTETNYVEQFENKGGNWVAQGWVNDNQEGTDWNFNGQNNWPANSNDQGIFWSTRNHQKYESKQRSALYSPCFDLTSKGYYPIMSFDYFTQLPDQKDGVYLEYSYDGKIWTRLTNDDSGFGRNWYNKGSISGLTIHTLPDASYGQEIEQLGWTDQSGGWVNAKYDLSGMTYKKKIRFRFLFGTNDDKKDVGDNGFAMDNFSIYPRNTTVLGEHFLDKSDAPDIDRFFAFREQDTLLIKVSYLSALRNGNDPEYLLNSADPSARSAYYGVATSAWSFINGVNKSDGKNIDVISWGTQVLGDRALDNSPVEISDIKVEIVDNNKLVISPKLRALTQTPKGTWVVQVLIVEDVNGRKIMRKILPNAAGTTLTAIQGRDQVFSQTYRWEAGNNINDVSKVGVIVFVQNLDTKSVMQVSYKKLTNLPSLSMITGFEDISEQATLYPNPAKGDIYLELPFSDVISVTLTNSAGQVLDLPYTLSGQLIKANVSTLAKGIYIIQVRFGKGIIQKKLAVSR